MSERNLPTLAKWPFFLGDLVLLAVAIFIVNSSPRPLGPWPLFFLVAAALAGAWLAVTPFLNEYRAGLKFAEADRLATTVQQMEKLHALGQQISFATAQWQTVQEQADRTLATGRDIKDRFTAEAQAFKDFLQKANDTERANLRLELEKYRRAEGEWLQAMVRVLDHVFALHRAAVRSGQPNLVQQLSSFQNACRDAVRRLGLVPFEAVVDAPFNEKIHQLADAEAKPPAQARVEETLATGYTFQGQLLRSAVVGLKTAPEPAPDPPVEPTAEAAPSSGTGPEPNPQAREADLFDENAGA